MLLMSVNCSMYMLLMSVNCCILNRVLAVCSVDGLHASDLTAYIALEPNSTLARLAMQGVIYPNAYLPGPSDSFPGILALTTGNNATVTGVYYGMMTALFMYDI